jgi:hypothetical protein
MERTHTNSSLAKPDYRDVIAQCCVAMAEVDYDLREWDKSLKNWTVK